MIYYFIFTLKLNRRFMSDLKKIISNLNENCKEYFPDTDFHLEPVKLGNRRFIISGNNLTKAMNNYKNAQEPVNVLKWFDDFWLYVEIEFIKIEIDMNLKKGIHKKSTNLRKDIDKKFYEKSLSENFLYIDDDKVRNFYETIITLSVFQGNSDDDRKSQLFRAEWDSFVEGGNHPQPHWHIHPNYSLEKIFNDIIGMSDDGNSFVELLNEEKSRDIDLKKIHFAMNGNWSNKSSHVHKINNEDAIVNWFKGLLAHIKTQLEYVKA